ncbi:MAG: LytR/AlgR family response regulator transcription factor [Bacteroidota bacterium]
MSSDHLNISKLVIAEDEPCEIRKIEGVVHDLFPEIKIIGKADNIKDAVTLIKNQKPDLAIFDINLKDGTAFEILEHLDVFDFQIIWTTGYEQYAIKAFRISAVDYLLKPYNTCDLVKAIRKAGDNISRIRHQKKLESLAGIFQPEVKNQIVLHTSEAFHIIKFEDIIYCMAENNYTRFILNDGPKLIVSKPLKHYEYLLEDHGFCRIHQSYLINLHKMKKFINHKKAFAIMVNSEKIPASKSLKSCILNYLDGLTD